MGGIVRLKIKMLFFLILSHGNPRSTGSFLKFIGIEFLQQNSTVPITVEVKIATHNFFNFCTVRLIFLVQYI